MKYHITLALISFFFINNASAQTVVHNVNVVDVENQKILHGYDVVSQNGKITYVGKDKKIKLPGNIKVID